MSRSTVRPPSPLVGAARRLARSDNHTNFLFIGVDWSIMVVAAALSQLAGGPLLYLLAVVAIGSRLRALANLMHEASHYKLFRNRTLNTVMGRVACAWPVVESLGVYTREHNLHHRTLWISDADPDRRLYRMTDTETASRPRMGFAQFLVLHVLLVLVPWQPTRRLLHDRRQLVRGLTLLAVSALLLVVVPSVGAMFALYWLVPWFTTYQMFGYWAELAEHGGLWERGWDWGSRNWSGHAVTRFLIAPHSTDLFHLAHHWFPAVPHWRLARLDRACQDLWPAYARELRCDGFFLSRSGDHTSVMRDMWSGGEPGVEVATMMPRLRGVRS